MSSNWSKSGHYDIVEILATWYIISLTESLNSDLVSLLTAHLFVLLASQMVLHTVVMPVLIGWHRWRGLQNYCNYRRWAVLYCLFVVKSPENKHKLFFRHDCNYFIQSFFSSSFLKPLPPTSHRFYFLLRVSSFFCGHICLLIGNMTRSLQRLPVMSCFHAIRVSIEKLAIIKFSNDVLWEVISD